MSNFEIAFIVCFSVYLALILILIVVIQVYYDTIGERKVLYIALFSGSYVLYSYNFKRLINYIKNYEKNRIYQLYEIDKNNKKELYKFYDYLLNKNYKEV